jgi:hypothetical protein
MSNTIQLLLSDSISSRKFDLTVKKVFCGGFTGRNKNSVKKHIAEMQSIGISPPRSTPTLYRISPYLITCDSEIEVVGDKTSGEIEVVIIIDSGETYLTVGSDQTDREIEELNYQKSKQICSKVIAKEVWSYGEVYDHFDSLILRSKVVKDGKKFIYQEDSVSLITRPKDLINIYQIKEKDGCVLFTGTIPTRTGKLEYASEYILELIDPILDRKITHSYNVIFI